MCAEGTNKIRRTASWGWKNAEIDVKKKKRRKWEGMRGNERRLQSAKKQKKM